jgi:hypothetical protein
MDHRPQEQVPSNAVGSGRRQVPPMPDGERRRPDAGDGGGGGDARVQRVLRTQFLSGRCHRG